MKVQRVNIIINRNVNKDLYLYNKVYDFAKQNKVGGEFGRDYITLRSVPENLLKILDDLKVKFERLGK